MLNQLARLWRLAKENSEAVDVALKAYEDGASLPAILDAFVEATDSQKVDDGVRAALLGSVGMLKNTLYNIESLILGIGATVSALRTEIEHVETRPFRTVLGDDPARDARDDASTTHRRNG